MNWKIGQQDGNRCNLDWRYAGGSASEAISREDSSIPAGTMVFFIEIRASRSSSHRLNNKLSIMVFYHEFATVQVSL